MLLTKILSNKTTLNIADRLTSQRVMKYYDFYSDAQWWSRSDLLKFQEKKLLDLMKVVFSEVSVYRQKYKKYGITYRDITSLDDLGKIPIMTKQELKKAYPHGCTRETPWPAREYYTSGSSGNPFATMVDNLSMSQARALMLLRANYGGWKMGDPILQTGMSLDRGIIKKLKDIFLGVQYVSAFDLSNDNLDRYLAVLTKRKIKFVMGYPGSIYALAVRASELGLFHKLTGVITWGDNLYNHFRKAIEAQFGCIVTDTYGCGEGIQVAAQCPEGYGGYHIFMPHVIVEIVDDNGFPVSNGELGNILLTKLEPGAMPFVRYRVGDVGRLSSEEKCQCGRGYQVLQQIEGRESDFIFTPNGNKLIVHFFTGIFEYFPQIKEFCVVQETLSLLNIQYVKDINFDPKILDEIELEIKNKGDKSLNITFEAVDEIKNQHGKRKFVRSKLI